MKRNQQCVIDLMCKPVDPALSERIRKPCVQNAVLCCDLGTTVDLKRIIATYPSAECKPRRFPPAIMRVRYPKTTGLIFASGSAVFVGARSMEHGRCGAQIYRLMLEELGYRTRLTNLRLTNLVINWRTGFNVKLESFYKEFPMGTRYEPEVFPGLNYTMQLPNGREAVFLIFGSGNIVASGVKAERDADDAARILYARLAKHKDNSMVLNPSRRHKKRVRAKGKDTFKSSKRRKS